MREFCPVVVFIDDGFAPANLDSIDTDDWASLRQTADAVAARWADIQEEHFPELRSIIDLKKGDAALGKAWNLYEAEPDKYSILDPVFKKVAAIRENAILRLKDILHYLERELELEVRKHPDIASAADDIRRSKLVFLDFYLYQATTAQAIDDVARFNELFSSKVTQAGRQYDRFLFLISTQLPQPDAIEQFRKAASVKTAFFKPVSKELLNAAWFTEEFGRRLQRYADLHRLASYLEVFSGQMKIVTESLKEDLESLELHDLAILDYMRLKEEKEDLGSYLAWIMSEALAARIRASAPMLEASREMNQVQRLPLHGMLSPNQVLFSWFAEISFGFPTGSKVQFGDIYTIVPAAVEVVLPSQASAATTRDGVEYAVPTANTGGATQDTLLVEAEVEAVGEVAPANEAIRVDFSAGANTPKSLLLVVAPACDLQRPKPGYEALCVRGVIVKETPSLFDLMEQKAILGKDKNSGSYKHLLESKSRGSSTYWLVEWHPERITTVPVAELPSRPFVRLARLNELFTQEVKEDALRQVGRVGVQVDPSFSVGLGATMVYTPKRNPPVHVEIDDTEIISGVFTSGNANNERQIILSEEFLERLGNEIRRLNVGDASLSDVVPKLEAGLAAMHSKGGQGHKLSAKEICTLADGKFTLHYKSSFVRESGERGFCGVYFYPRGTVSDATVAAPHA